jgi:hypothetical protein
MTETSGEHQTVVITVPVGAGCPVLGCPRQRQLERVIREAISVLERTRSAFKSRQLADLRRHLEEVLAEQP